MRTNEFVKVLAADAHGTVPPQRLLISAALASGAVLCALFVALVGVRPDLLSALGDPRVAFKFAFAGSAVLAAAAYGMRAVRPEDRSSPLAFALPVTALLGVAIALELSLTSRAEWSSLAQGASPSRCLTTIFVLSLPATAALIAAMRSGAPRRPTLAGAAAGLGGGAIGAAVFALYCTNDSTLFVAVWYVLGMLISGAIGAAVGASKLAW